MTQIPIERTNPDDPIISVAGFRLSWGGIFAGLVVAIGLEVTFGLLGIGLGIDIGTGAALWAAGSALVALFLGGLVTGRLAGVLKMKDGLLHGVVLWGLSTVATFWLVWNGLGFVLGHTLDLVGQTASAAVSGVTQVGAAAVGQVGNVNLSTAETQIETALRQTGDPALQPDSLRAAAQRVANRATTTGASNADIIQQLGAMVANRAGQIDRQDVINVITARTDLSQPQAQRVADRVVSAANSLGATVSSAANSVGSTANRLANGAQNTIQSGAWWALLMIVLSIGAAVGGTAITSRD